MLNVQSTTAPRTESTVTPSIGGCGIAVWLDDWKYYVREKYMHVYSKSGVPVTLTEGSSGSTSHSIGVIARASSGTLSLSGTTSKSYSHEVSVSNLYNSSVSNRVNMRRQGVSCDQKTYWKQYSMYDYLTDITSVTHVSYSFCSTKLTGTSWTTSTATSATQSTGLSFPNLSASAQSGFGTSQKMTFHFNVSGKICGNSVQGPLSSSKVDAH